jgi:flagellar hook-basal body complex protein FliE
MSENSVYGVNPIRPERVQFDPEVPRPARTGATSAPGSFKEVLSETIKTVNRLQVEADTTIQKVVAGEIKDVTDAMVAVEKADIAFQTMSVLTNKMIAAYQEIMRMQV